MKSGNNITADNLPSTKPRGITAARIVFAALVLLIGLGTVRAIGISISDSHGRVGIAPSPTQAEMKTYLADPMVLDVQALGHAVLAYQHDHNGTTPTDPGLLAAVHPYLASTAEQHLKALLSDRSTRIATPESFQGFASGYVPVVNVIWWVDLSRPHGKWNAIRLTSDGNISLDYGTECGVGDRTIWQFACK